MKVTEDKDQVEKEKAEQLIAETPLMDGVESISVELRDDSTGDPAMWLVFHLRSDLKVDVPWIQRFNEYSGQIQMRILHSGLTRFPYTRLEPAA